MGKNKFTEEQQNQLRMNPYIEKVSETSITYTKDFKEKFSHEYATGKGPSTILSEMGLDPKLLGKQRRDSIVARMKSYSNRIDGYEDLRGKSQKESDTTPLTEAELIKKYEHRIRLLEQQVDFLKKNEFLDWQAQVREKSKQHHTRNSK